MRNSVLSLLTAFVLCVSISSIPVQASERPTFTITQTAMLYVQQIPIRWAMNHGLYEKAGLNVVTKKARYSADRAMVISGQADASWYAPTYFRVREKFCTRLVYDFTNWYPMLFLGTVDSFDELRGKAIAASNIESPIVRKIFEKRNTPLKLVVVGNSSKRLLDVLAERSSAALLWHPLAAVAKHLVQTKNGEIVDKMNVLASGKEAAPWTPGGVVVRCDYIKAHPETVETFVKVTAKAAREVVEPKNEEAVKSFIREKMNIDDYLRQFSKQNAFNYWHLEKGVTLDQIVSEMYARIVKNLNTSAALDKKSARKIIAISRLEPVESIDLSRYIWEPEK